MIYDCRQSPVICVCPGYVPNGFKEDTLSCKIVDVLHARFCFCGEPVFDEWHYQGVLYRGRDVSLAPILNLRTHYELRVVVQSAQVNTYRYAVLTLNCWQLVNRPFSSAQGTKRTFLINNLLSSIILDLASRTLFGFLRSLLFHYMYYKPNAPHSNCYPFNDFQLYMFICL